MTKVKIYKTNRAKRKIRVRSKIKGTGENPRLSVFRSNKYIHAQLIDDIKGTTLAAASDEKITKGTKIERALEVGKMLAEEASKKGIKTAVFDRSGYRYHGRVKSLADGAREKGLKF